MSVPGRQFHFRMPAEMAERFDTLRSEFSSLPTPVLIRLLLSSTLNRPLSKQIRAIQSEIRRRPPDPGEKLNEPAIAVRRGHRTLHPRDRPARGHFP